MAIKKQSKYLLVLHFGPCIQLLLAATIVDCGCLTNDLSRRRRCRRPSVTPFFNHFNPFPLE